MNFASRDSCFGCKAPKSRSVVPSFSMMGDERIVNSGNNRNRDRSDSRRNSAGRNAPRRLVPLANMNNNNNNNVSQQALNNNRVPNFNDGGMGKGGGKGDKRPGDWECPDCGVNNFANRQECFKCGCPKDKLMVSASGNVYDNLNTRGNRGNTDRGGGNNNHGFKNGDWDCAKCDFHNFARNTACKNCGAYRNDAEGVRKGLGEINAPSGKGKGKTFRKG